MDVMQHPHDMYVVEKSPVINPDVSFSFIQSLQNFQSEDLISLRASDDDSEERQLCSPRLLNPDTKRTRDEQGFLFVRKEESKDRGCFLLQQCILPITFLLPILVLMIVAVYSVYLKIYTKT